MSDNLPVGPPYMPGKAGPDYHARDEIIKKIGEDLKVLRKAGETLKKEGPTDTNEEAYEDAEGDVIQDEEELGNWADRWDEKLTPRDLKVIENALNDSERERTKIFNEFVKPPPTMKQWLQEQADKLKRKLTSQYFAVPPYLDPTPLQICTVPAQTLPYVLQSVHMEILAVTTNSARAPFVQILQGGVEYCWQWASETTMAPGDTLFFNAFENANVSTSLVGSVSQTYQVAPLPLGLVLDANAKITFGFRGGSTDDVMSNSGVVLKFV